MCCDDKSWRFFIAEFRLNLAGGFFAAALCETSYAVYSFKEKENTPNWSGAFFSKVFHPLKHLKIFKTEAGINSALIVYIRYVISSPIDALEGFEIDSVFLPLKDLFGQKLITQLCVLSKKISLAH